MHSFLLNLHVCSAAVGLISGALAMILRKGSGLHRAAGDVFTLSMLSMGSVAVYLAIFMKPNIGNAMGGFLVSYLVTTGWMAGRRGERKAGLFDVGALLFVFGIGAAEATFGFQAAASPTGLKAGYPPGLFFVFGSFALLFAASDARMLLRGGVSGAQKLARHLWRMCFAFMLALASFYPGQARIFPQWLRDTKLLYVPHVLFVGATFFGLYRVSRRKRAEKGRAIEATQPERIAIAA
jgi:uncharacterized membrane protein